MIPETFKRQTSESVRSVYDRLVDIEDAFQLLAVSHSRLDAKDEHVFLDARTDRRSVA